MKEEDDDNRRFLADCEQWFRRDITILRDQEYGASTHEVWMKKRFMKGLRGAPCSMLLKRRLLAAVRDPDDITVIGYTSEEEDRAFDLEHNFPNERFEFPLIERGLSKSDCLAIISDAGLTLPRMYLLGYDNANCIGCPKGGQNYWQRIRRDFPQQFIQIQAIQQDIGPGANFLRFRSGPRSGERMSLASYQLEMATSLKKPAFPVLFYCEDAKAEIG